MQERHNSIANALELRCSCTKPIDMISPGTSEEWTARDTRDTASGDVQYIY